MFSIIIPAYNSEKYLSITLESLINQSYQNFEVILINDGSTDSTQDIIEDYCQKFSNFKSISQKNQGVGTARNNGMKIAKGDYIGFLDSDGDTYTKNALKHYHDTIINNKMPDLVIGRQTMVDFWDVHYYANAKKLSNSKVIEPHNKWIIWTMSLLNKVFSRKKIIETGLKMPLFSYASDGAFVLPFAYLCDNIVGCPHEIIIYNKRMFFDEYSISQTSSMETLNDYLEVHDVILNKFLEYSERYREIHSNSEHELAKFEENYLIYLDALLYRQVSILISQFYRFFWRTDIEVLKKVKKTILTDKTEMFPTSWEKLRKNNKDLDLDDLILEKEEMVKNNHVSIAIDENIKGNSLIQMIYNIQNFTFISFELFISKSSFDSLPTSFKEKKYIKTIKYHDDAQFKNDILNNANGKFLLYLDEIILMSLKLLNIFFNRMYNSHFDFVEVNSKQFKSNMLKNNEIYYKSLSNMFIKIEFLKRINFEFGGNISKNIDTIYECGNYSKINKDLILISEGYFEKPLISFIIDDMDIKVEELDNLFDSIYKQTVTFFNIYLNEKFKKNISEKYLNRPNLNIVDDDNFKKICIKNSKTKYSIFVDVPVTYEKNTIKELLSNIEKNKDNLEDISFLSTPIYQANNDNNRLDYLSSQKLSYFYKNVSNPSKKSKFFVFDLYLANKLFNLNYLRKNKIYFDESNKDMLKIYKTSKSLRIYKKLISTKLLQKDLFKHSFKNKNVPFSANIFYKTNKLFLILLCIKNALKNGGR